MRLILLHQTKKKPFLEFSCEFPCSDNLSSIWDFKKTEETFILSMADALYCICTQENTYM